MPKSKNIEYRRRTTKGHHKWHFCKGCRDWPKASGNVEKSYIKPKRGELCDLCLGEDNDRKCEKVRSSKK